MTLAVIHICSPRIYEYGGWIFEYGQNVWPLKKDFEPRKRAGDKFYKMLDKFVALEDQEKFRVGGGCEHFSTDEGE